jgi:hypothetical protein
MIAYVSFNVMLVIVFGGAALIILSILFEKKPRKGRK